MFEKVEVELELELELEGGSGSGSGLVVQCGWKGTKSWYQWHQGVVTVILVRSRPVEVPSKSFWRPWAESPGARDAVSSVLFARGNLGVPLVRLVG